MQELSMCWVASCLLQILGHCVKRCGRRDGAVVMAGMCVDRAVQVYFTSSSSRRPHKKFDFFADGLLSLLRAYHIIYRTQLFTPVHVSLFDVRKILLFEITSLCA
eukprot:GHVS01017225.1.p1 GENE.GHVS01017225.1~~GHVS01017225.1.p1  ORF type:complete len:105 (+),score=2.61 GHVS01017225.1:269-583(+)